MTIPETIAHLERILGALDRPPILMGHSAGGFLVQALLDHGYGAAGVAIAKILLHAGVPHVIGVDRKGAVWEGRDDLNPAKQWFAENTNPEGVRDVGHLRPAVALGDEDLRRTAHEIGDPACGNHTRHAAYIPD